MDHRYIDQRSVAERYLNHTLSPEERAEFERHLVDCQECTDRLLLAEMFHNRNGVGHAEPAPEPGEPQPVAMLSLPSLPRPVPRSDPEPVPGPSPSAPDPMRVRFVRQFSPWQLLAILAGAALLLVLVTAGLLLWALRFGGLLR